MTSDDNIIILIASDLTAIILIASEGSMRRDDDNDHTGYSQLFSEFGVKLFPFLRSTKILIMVSVLLHLLPLLALSTSSEFCLC